MDTIEGRVSRERKRWMKFDLIGIFNSNVYIVAKEGRRVSI